MSKYTVTFDVCRVSTYKVVVEANTEEEADALVEAHDFEDDDLETVYFSDEGDWENIEIVDTEVL